MTPSNNRLHAYLVSLGIPDREPICQRDMDYLAEENQDGAGSAATDPTPGLASRHLQHWVDSACSMQMNNAEVQWDFAAIDERLSAPPIRRTYMPVARLESPQFVSWVHSLLVKVISVRIAAVQTFRRFVMQT